MIKRILRKTGVSRLVKKHLLNRRIKAERIREEHLVTEHLHEGKFIPLTAEEKEMVDALWSGIDGIKQPSYREFEMFKYIYGFDARFLTHSHYLPVIARLLNDFRYTKLFDDKGLLGYLKTSDVRFPKCYVRHLVSDFYDDAMHQLSLDEAIEACASQDELFIKPSRETSGGKGVKLLNLRDASMDERRRIIRKELLDRSGDFVVQECLHQHPVMAQFNPSSINTFRITTLMINGRFSLGSIVLRFGKAGSKVDNWGAGGIMTSVTPDGNVGAKGYDIQLNEYTENGGCVFAECFIHQMPDILERIEKCHREDFALCKFIGWDVTIDENGEPVIIELNSSQPGVICEQIFTGPIFGDRTQEVINYCRSKEFSY